MKKSDFSSGTNQKTKNDSKANTTKKKNEQSISGRDENGHLIGALFNSGFDRHVLTEYMMEVTLSKDTSCKSTPEKGAKETGVAKKGKYTTKITATCYDTGGGIYESYFIDGKGWVLGNSSGVSARSVQKEKRYEISTSSKNNTPLYREPSTSSEIVRYIPKGSSLNGSRVVKKDGKVEWYWVPLYKGYIKADKVEKVVSKTSTTAYKTQEQKDKEKDAKNKKKKKIQDILDYTDEYIAKIEKNKDLDKWINEEKDMDIRKAKIDRISRYHESLMANKFLEGSILGGLASGTEGMLLEDAANALLNSDPMGFFGIPYQFDENTDEKLPGGIYGVTYARRILSRMPIMMVTPGRAQFMADFKNSDKFQELCKLLGMNSTDEYDSNGVTLADLIGSNTTGGEIINSGRYFTFEFDDANYFKYVNPMCQAGAKFLGIDKAVIGVETANESGESKNEVGRLISFDWSKAIVNSIKRNIRAEKTISFYVDGYTTSDEDFSNSTTESQLANKINQFADIGREIQFLLGTPSGHTPDWMKPVDLESTLNDIQAMSDKYLKENGLLTDIAKNFATVATGGQLLFPEIWADSEYSKSFSVSIKLRTPDNDVLSWYLNIYVPICHLVALTLPRQVETDEGNRVPNGYMSPFLIRAYLKGAFNCDCGIVTSLSISRGKEGSWNINGLPTEVDVNISFKDLYSMIMLSKSTNKVGWFMANTGLMDYIACNCGVNINEPDLKRQISMYVELVANKYLQMPNRMWSELTQSIEHGILSLYRKIGV